MTKQGDLETILNNATDALFVLDSSWRFVFLNTPAQRWWLGAHSTGTPTLVGQNVWETFPDAVEGHFYRAAHHALRDKVALSYDLHLSEAQWRSVCIYPAGSGLVVYFADVTKHKLRERELLQGLQNVMNETVWFNQTLVAGPLQAVSGTVRTGLAELTRREKQVLERIAAGKTNAEIGEALDLAERTVRNYITNIYSKLGVHSRAEAVVWARERGLSNL